LLNMRQGGCQKCRLLPTIGKWPAISAAERRAGIAQCHLSKLTGKLIEEEQQFSAAVMIDGNSYKATIDTGATASFVSSRGGGQTREQTSDHEPVDFTRSSGSISVGMELPERSRNRDKVCLTRDNNTSQEPTQWVARGESISSSRATSKRVGRYYSVP